MPLKSGAKFKDDGGFKYDVRNLVNFNPTTQKVENFTLIGSFCPNYIRFELKQYRRVIFHDTKLWCKVWINPDLKASKMAWRIGLTFIRALISLKHFTVMSAFLSKAHNMFQPENFREIMCHDTKGSRKI